MTLVMTLLVRDEEDILREHLRYHLSQGVDFIVATDNNSVDGTVDILREFQASGVLHLIHEPNDTFAQGEWVTRMAQLSYNEFRANWVINSDADEFWWPQEGNLKHVLSKIPGNLGAVQVQRSNFVPRPESEGSLFDRMIVRDRNSVNALGRPLPRKVCHRGMADVVVAQGNHKLLVPSNSMIKYNLIEILHFPIRSYPQLANKIEKGGAAYARNTDLPLNVGDTWRKLYEDQKKGLLPDYFHSKLLVRSEIDQGIAQGNLVIDTRLRDYLRSKKIL